MTGGESQSAKTEREQLISDIRDDFSYFKSFWRENYDEAKVDLRYVAGDPWEAGDRRAREDSGRPVVSPDELEQYLNATINNLRQNPLGIKIDPKGEGATSQNAERRQSIIRNIENDSVAQSAYTNGYSCSINCGFGYWRVTTCKTKRGSDEVEPRIKIIGNPLSVLMDPNAKEADYSDQKRCFVIDVMRQRDFARAYPKATKRSFSSDDISDAPDWFEAENIVVAEYWRIEGYDEDGYGGKVKQYVTNGVEILSETDWPGSRIPIIPVLGKEVYVPQGGKMARMFYSMVRKARGPQMMLAYIASQEAEEYGMAPRAPFVGYVGQFETDKDAWETLNKVPRAYVQVDPLTDLTNSPLPLPTRPAFVPNAQAYEMGFERWRRSIQAAMGITPLPTAAQRQNEKSGVALQRIENQQAVGAYHFTANFKLALQNTGFQVNELITKVLDTSREIAGRGQDDEQKLIHVVPNGQQPPPQAEGQQKAETFDPSQGEYDVTISSGPSYQSQREAASQFADLLVQQIDALPVAPQAKSKLLALSVKLKNIGPLGDEMADILDPQQQQEIPPQAQAQMAQMQQQLQVAHHVGTQLYQKVQELEFEKKAQVVQHQAKLQAIHIQHQADLELEDKKLLAQVTVAEINTKAQNAADREADRRALEAQFHDQAHDYAAQKDQQAHDQQLAEQQAQQQQALASQQAEAQSAQSAQDAGQQSVQSQQDAQQAQDSQPEGE